MCYETFGGTLWVKSRGVIFVTNRHSPRGTAQKHTGQHIIFESIFEKEHLKLDGDVLDRGGGGG